MEKSFKDRLFIKFASIVIFCILWAIYLTCKKRFIGKPVSKEPCVVLFWHGKLAMFPFVFKRWWQGKSAKVIISDHKDGRVISTVSSYFGIGTISGSSSKGALKALLQAFREIKAGVDVVITPDGPRGPRHSISDGCVVIPQKMEVNIVILKYTATKFWQFKSWDKMILPKPFSIITYTLSEPFSVAHLGLDEAKELIAKHMQES
ncbi:DUF374 domain-containing protein [Campylobacter hyointestinalis]|uniref:DUF374 domain-containing protein n=1 Tax=Campylobacter hyointestinalis TaxID=198 RepID=A0A562XJY7_CAMHY|nr:lysophospholipid acyltransferase family protein [Campylobacter hyointestinalis]TWO21976.1 DUF374 domain-containing protein [Campylobacter hyointestinalis]